MFPQLYQSGLKGQYRHDQQGMEAAPVTWPYHVGYYYQPLS